MNSGKGTGRSPLGERRMRQMLLTITVIFKYPFFDRSSSPLRKVQGLDNDLILLGQVVYRNVIQSELVSYFVTLLFALCIISINWGSL